MKGLSKDSDFYFKKDFQSYRRLFILGMLSTPDNSLEEEYEFGFDPDEINDALAWEIASQVAEDMFDYPEELELNVLEIQKIRNTFKFSFNNIDANQRGSKWRWAEKNIDGWWGERYLEYKKKGPDPDEDDGHVFDFEIPKIGNGTGENAFLCEGMTVVISANGKTSAVCFNTNYKGTRKINE
jgi:hypothetical protein